MLQRSRTKQHMITIVSTIYRKKSSEAAATVLRRPRAKYYMIANVSTDHCQINLEQRLLCCSVHEQILHDRKCVN